MAFHDDEEKEGGDLLESAVDEVLEKDEDEDLDIPVNEIPEDDKWE